MDTCIHYINDTIKCDMNPLTDKIMHKEEWYEISSKIFIWKYIRFLESYYTPSFDFLCCIYDFVIFLENICMFHNDGTQGIRAYHNLKNGVKSFIIHKDDLFCVNGKNMTMYTIEYTLYPDHRINIKIKRSWGDKVTTNITFIADEPMLLSESDQMLFDSIISDTMKIVSSIFYYYHRHIKPMKYNQINCNDSFDHS